MYALAGGQAIIICVLGGSSLSLSLLITVSVESHVEAHRDSQSYGNGNYNQ